MADETPWSGFRAQAGSGVLQLEPYVLEGLVNAANGTRVRVRSVRGQVGLIDNLARFADVLASADMLARRFSSKGQDFGRILDDHVRILDDLNETFMAAARTYIANEDQGSANFELLRQRITDHRSPTLLDTLGNRPPPADLSLENDRHSLYGDPRTMQPTWNEPGNRRPEENFGLPPGLVDQPGLQFDPQAGLHAEEPGSISYQQYRMIRDSILGGTPTQVAQAAADWRWLATELGGSFSILTTQMAGTQGSWTSTDSGGAAERARQAVQAYGQGADNLMRTMNAIGDALEYTSEWLYTTGAGLASFVSADPRINEDIAAYNARVERAALAHYTRVMNDTYVPGVEHTAQVIAVLPDPIPPVTGDRPTLTGGQGTGGQQGGYGGSGRQFSGGGGAPGGGAPGGGSPEQLALLQQEGQAQGGPGDGQGGPGELGAGELGAGEYGAGGQGEGIGAGGLTPQQRQALAAGEGLGAGQSGGNPLEQLGQLGQLGEQLSQAGQQLLGAGQGGFPGGLAGIPALASLADLPEQVRKPGGGAGGGSGGGAGGGAGGGLPGERSAALDKASRLFPRATALAAELGTARAGIAASSGMPMGGMPMGGPMGGAGGAQGGQEKDHKRAEYLDSTEHLEEAFGEAPVVVRPVVDQ
ncbi:WXG100 family type VII secretion target [Nocardia harenae]|uniref:WXG100 family type VII secretion target n=1 Tax=Nocardia harenae TaxID=358707 RepID=UPI00082D6905|nr:hypothetical protein [Nocardia harenae]